MRRADILIRACVFLLVLALLVPSVDAWWNHHRHHCSAVNCVWGGWSQWTGCTHACGSAGTRSRSRSVARGASCGGAGCSGPSSESQPCNRFCPNGGTPHPGYCSCPDGYYSTCCLRKELSTGQKVGISFGAIVPIVILLVIALRCYQNQKKLRKHYIDLGTPMREIPSD